MEDFKTRREIRRFVHLIFERLESEELFKIIKLRNKKKNANLAKKFFENSSTVPKTKKKKIGRIKRLIIENRNGKKVGETLKEQDMNYHTKNKRIETLTASYLKKLAQKQKTEMKAFKILKKKREKLKKKSANLKFQKRFVFGLSETLQKMRFFRETEVKMIIFADDIERSGTIDKIQMILDKAKENNVPVFFMPNRKNLGKDLMLKRVKVSCVAVIKKTFDAEFDEIEKLIAKEKTFS